MANLRAAEDQEPRRLVDEDPDKHSHPLFRMNPGMKMLGAEETKESNVTEEGTRDSQEMKSNISRKYYRQHFKMWRHTRTPNRATSWEGDGWEEDKRGSKAQGPATKP